MAKNETNEASTETTDAVNAKVSEAQTRLDEVAGKLAEVRQVMADARTKRDQSINDAERVYSDQYTAGRNAQQSELTALDEAYNVLRQEIVSRHSTSFSGLSEARDAAVSAANESYERTQEASKLVFGENV
jgi:hypothetical protein